MIEKLRYWCHRILPLVYDDSLSYYEVLAKLTSKLNEVINWINDGFREFIEQQLAQIFVDTTYDATTETLDFSIDTEGEAEGSGEIANISVNQVSRPVKDAIARGDIDALETEVSKIIGVGQSNILVVAKRGARFSTINDAIDYAKTYCSLTNRVTIVVIGGYNVVYREYIDLDNNPGIDFFGISSPILQSSVAWRLSTLRCSNNITVDGFWFMNYYTPQSGESAGYGLHADPVTGKQTYRNCYFYSDHNAGAGIGMGANGSIDFIHCTFEGPEGVYMHNNATNGTRNQWIRFNACNFRGDSNHQAVRVYDAATASNTTFISEMGLKFINCTAYPNTKVKYTYNGNTNINYIPSSNRASGISNANIFVVADSISPGLLGVDYFHNTQKFRLCYRNFEGGTNFIQIENANRYNWTATAGAYSNDNGSTWTNFSNLPGTQFVTYDDRPSELAITVYGLQPTSIIRLDVVATAK